MPHLKFDPAKLEKLNDPGRFDDLIPKVMWDALALRDPEVIVEIGAGTGLFAERFAEMAPGSTVYAADIEPVMIDWMNRNRPSVVTGRLIPVLVAETRIPLLGEIADAVVMINLHHELAEPAATYAEAARLLRPGGRLLVADWARRETPKGPPLAVRASEEELVAMLAGAGFTDVVAHRGLPHHSLVTGTRG